MLNIDKTKETIIEFLKQNGPALPVHISRHIKTEPMFASAILGELLNEKRIKTSDMRIGSSPLYLIPGQEAELENHSNNLTGTEKEAFLKLKEKKILKDEDQSPQFRVALRSIKDFASPFKIQDTLYWKYLTTTNNEIQELLSTNSKPKENIEKKEQNKDNQKQEESKTNEKENTNKESEKVENNPNETKEQNKEKPKLEQIFEKKPVKKPKSTESEFVEEVKNYLQEKSIELIYIEESKKREVTAKIRINHKNETTDYLLVAYNKKRITEKDIYNAYKKAEKSQLPYYVLARSDPPKKVQKAIDVYKSLLQIDKIK